MKRNAHTLLLFFIVLIASCTRDNEAEEALQLFIPNSHNLITKELDSKGIPYRVDKQAFIWYPSSYKSEISNINAKITAELSPTTSAAFNDIKLLNIAKSRFEENNISYTLDTYNKDVIINWEDENDVAGTIIIHEIFFQNNHAL